MIELLATVQDESGVISLDLIDDADVELTLSAQDLRDYKARQGGYTQSFALPFTAVNNQFFQMYFDVENDSQTFNSYKKTKVEILSDSIPQITGYLKLEQVQWKARIYKVTVFSQVAELARELGAKKLRELDSEWLEGYDHNLTMANIEESWSRSLVTTNGNGDDIVYPFVNYGGGITFGDNSGSDITQSGGGALNDYYFRPFFRLKALFDQVLHEAGFYYDSTFLNSTRFDTIFMSLANTKEGTQALSFPYNLYLSNGGQTNGFTIPSSPPIQQANEDIQIEIEPPATIGQANSINTYDVGQILNGATNEITIPKTGDWGFLFVVDADITLQFGDDNDIRFDYFARVLRNGSEVILEPFGVPIFGEGRIYFNYNFTEFFIAGDVVEFQLRLRYTANNAPATNVTIDFDRVAVGNGKSFVEITSQPNNIANDLVGIRRNLPDMKQIDFLRGVSELFNLIIEPDTQEPNKLYIEPYNEYLASGDSLDWTEKLDISKDVIISPTHQFRSAKVKFEFADSKGYGSQWWRDNRDREINSFVYDADDEFAEGEQTIKLPFGTMPFVSRFDRNNNNIETVLKAGEDNDSTAFIDFEPFLAYLPQVNGTMNTIKIFDNTLDTIGEYDNYAIASPYNLGTSISSLPVSGNGASNDRYDLSFGFGENYSSTNLLSKPTLTSFNSFWADYIKDIYSPESRIMVAYFQLSDTDIFNLRLNAVIWVKDAYWRINKLTGHKIGGKESTKVELLKIVDNIGIYQNCTLRIDYINPQGQVFFDDGENDDLIGNEACCEAYGFNWRESVSSGEITLEAGCFARTTPTSDNPTNQRPGGGEPQPTGACCIPDGEGGNVCVDTDANLCLQLGGTYKGDNTSCAIDGCE